MRRREGDPPSVLHFAANRPREFPFAPGFGILGPSPPLKSSTAPPFSSFPPCRYHHRSRLSEASRDTPTAAVLVNVCFSRHPPTVLLQICFFSFFPTISNFPLDRTGEIRESRGGEQRGRFARGHNLNAASAGGDRDRGGATLCPSLSNGRTTPRCPQTDLQQRCLGRSLSSAVV